MLCLCLCVCDYTVHTHIIFFLRHDSPSYSRFSHWMETLEIHLIEFSSKCHTILVLKPICHAAIGSALQHLKQRSSPASSLEWCEVKSNSDSRGSTHSQQCFDTCPRVDLKHSWWWSTRRECSSGLKIERVVHFYMHYMCELSHGELENEVRSAIMLTPTLKESRFNIWNTLTIKSQ